AVTLEVELGADAAAVAGVVATRVQRSKGLTFSRDGGLDDWGRRRRGDYYRLVNRVRVRDVVGRVVAEVGVIAEAEPIIEAGVNGVRRSIVARRIVDAATRGSMVAAGTGRGRAFSKARLRGSRNQRTDDQEDKRNQDSASLCTHTRSLLKLREQTARFGFVFKVRPCRQPPQKTVPRQGEGGASWRSSSTNSSLTAEQGHHSMR